MSLRLPLKVRGNLIVKFYNLTRMIFLAAFLGFSSLGIAEVPEIESLLRQGDARLTDITEANCRAALQSYESVLQIDSNHYEANWKAARALCLILNLQTSALIEEKAAYRPALIELGGKAVRYSEKAYIENPKGKEALTWYLTSYGYHASGLGILKAILKGAGGKLKKLSQELIEIDDTCSGALGYRMMARFHLSAPFPIGSKKKAVEYAEKSVAKAPDFLINHYWLGEAYLKNGAREKARVQFQFILDHPPTQEEAHFAPAIREASQRQIQKFP